MKAAALLLVASGCQWVFNLSEIGPLASDATPADGADTVDASIDAMRPPGCVTYTNMKVISTMGANSLAALDYDGDGRDDLAIGGAARTTIQLVHNTPAGLVELGVSQLPTVLAGTSKLYGYDFGDGRATLLVANGSTEQVNAYFDVGGNNMSSAVTTLAGESVAVFHRNDGLAIVASSNSTLDKIALSTWNGSAFVATGVLDVSKAQNMAVGRFGPAGVDDLAVAEHDTKEVSVLLDGPNGFDPPSSLTTTSNVRDVITGDFDGDGTADLAVLTAAGVVPFMNDGLANFIARPEIMVTSGGIARGYLGDDGLVDLVVSRSSGFDIYFGTTETLELVNSVPTSSDPNEMLIANVLGGPANEIVATFPNFVVVYGCD